MLLSQLRHKMASGIRNQGETQWLWVALMWRDDLHALHKNQPKSKEVETVIWRLIPRSIVRKKMLHLGGRKEPSSSWKQRCMLIKDGADLGGTGVQGKASEIGVISSQYNSLNRAVTQWKHYFITNKILNLEGSSLKGLLYSYLWIPESLIQHNYW